MYRIVFKSLAPRTHLLDVQVGPWHPSREIAEYWRSYFESIGHLAEMVIEERTNSGMPENSRLTHVS